MRHTVPAVLLVVAGLVPCTLQAQETAPCMQYRPCALRVASGGWFSGPRIVRGVEGISVADFGRSDTLESLFAASDSAAAHYRMFAAHDRRADRLRIVGGVLAVGGLVGLTAVGAKDWAQAVYVGGVIVTLVGVRPARRATTELHRAIWWYNATLAAQGDGRAGAANGNLPAGRWPQR